MLRAACTAVAVTVAVAVAVAMAPRLVAVGGGGFGIGVWCTSWLLLPPRLLQVKGSAGPESSGRWRWRAGAGPRMARQCAPRRPRCAAAAGALARPSSGGPPWGRTSTGSRRPPRWPGAGDVRATPGGRRAWSSGGGGLERVALCPHGGAALIASSLSPFLPPPSSLVLASRPSSRPDRPRCLQCGPPTCEEFLSSPRSQLESQVPPRGTTPKSDLAARRAALLRKVGKVGKRRISSGCTRGRPPR